MRAPIVDVAENILFTFAITFNILILFVKPIDIEKKEYLKKSEAKTADLLESIIQYAMWSCKYFAKF